jgi:hypothetical protein
MRDTPYYLLLFSIILFVFAIAISDRGFFMPLVVVACISLIVAYIETWRK